MLINKGIHMCAWLDMCRYVCECEAYYVCRLIHGRCTAQHTIHREVCWSSRLGKRPEIANVFPLDFLYENLVFVTSRRQRNSTQARIMDLIFSHDKYDLTKIDF